VELDLIFGKLIRVSRHIKCIVEAENYLLFKHFLRTFNLSTERLKRSEIPSKVRIPQLLKENIEI